MEGAYVCRRGHAAAQDARSGAGPEREPSRLAAGARWLARAAGRDARWARPRPAWARAGASAVSLGFRACNVETEAADARPGASARRPLTPTGGATKSGRAAAPTKSANAQNFITEQAMAPT